MLDGQGLIRRKDAEPVISPQLRDIPQRNLN